MENSINILYNSKNLLVNLTDLNSSINKLPQKNDLIKPMKTNSKINQNVISIKFSILQIMNDISNIMGNYKLQDNNIINDVIYKELSFFKKKKNYMISHKVNYDLIEEELLNTFSNFNSNINPLIEEESKKLIKNKKINKINKEINKNLPHLIAKKSLQQKDKLIEKTRIKNYAYNILGLEDDNFFYPEIYEDFDLKNLFIKDLKILDNKNSDNLIINFNEILEKRKEREKIKNQKMDYDNKASKDRKIRYEIMEKLVNFMPTEENNYLWENREDIINNLFGNKQNNKILNETKDEIFEDKSIRLI